MVWVKTEPGTEATSDGIFTSVVPKRPIQFDARMLPRCGVEMKMTRFMSLRWLNIKDSSRSFRLAPGRIVSAGGLPK
jgi:hypothetical protein